MKILPRLISSPQKGFTLLELLVVIAVIGILVALGTASFTTAQQKSRDARRRGDVKAMQNALEQYYANNSSSYADGCSNLGDYIPGGSPTDPKTGVAYHCEDTDSSYCVRATLEDTDSGNCNSCTPATDGTHFCLSELQ
jgi:prepilin-type N-terminal cleavage/methylation domain-containing protein